MFQELRGEGELETVNGLGGPPGSEWIQKAAWGPGAAGAGGGGLVAAVCLGMRQVRPGAHLPSRVGPGTHAPASPTQEQNQRSSDQDPGRDFGF